MISLSLEVLLLGVICVLVGALIPSVIAIVHLTKGRKELARRLRVVEKALGELHSWVSQSHEPWLHRHESRLSVLSVRVEGQILLLDKEIALLADAQRSSGGAEPLLQQLTDLRLKAQDRRLLPPGESGPCEGIRLVRGDRDTLFVVFGGMWENFLWMRRLNQLGAPAVYVIDSSVQWYLNGCDGSRTSQRMVEYLHEAIAQLGHRRIVTMGISMGGYAALRYAPELKADAVIAFAPQTHHLASTSRQGAVLKSPPKLAPDLRPQINASGIPTHIFISRSEDNNPPYLLFWDDHAQVSGLKGKHVEVHVVNCNDHGVSFNLANAGLLNDSIESVLDILQGRPPRLDLDRLLEQAE